MHARVGKRPLIIKYRTAEEERRHYCYGLNHQKSSRAWHYGARVSRTAYVRAFFEQPASLFRRTRSIGFSATVRVCGTYVQNIKHAESLTHRTSPLSAAKHQLPWSFAFHATVRSWRPAGAHAGPRHSSLACCIASRLDSVSRRRLQLALVVAVVRWLLGARWTGCCCWCFPPGPCTIPMWRDVSRGRQLAALPFSHRYTGRRSQS